MPIQIDKVYAYITNGDRLLVFTHTDFPEAGLQVPGGTLEPGEDPDEGVLREAFEETGLTNLVREAFLGHVAYDMAPHGRVEIAHRHFYHLRCPGDAAETWRHWERHPSDVDQREISFDFFWAPLDAVPPLIAGMDALLPALNARSRGTAG